MFENDTRFTGSTSPSFARNNAIRVHGYSSLSLFIFLTLRRRLKMSSRIIDKERGCVISVEGRCKQRCFSLRDPRSWRKIVNERVGSGSWPSKWQAENDALALRLRIQSGSRFRSPTANNYVIEASRVFLVGRGGRDRSPGSGEYYILASVHYVTGERQSLVGRIRDWILRGWRNLNPHLLPGGRTQEIQWVFATTPRIQSFFPILLFFLKVRITLFSVENVENAFSSATEKTPLRLLVFPSGRHGSSSRSIVPMHARTTRLHTHSK